MQMLVDQLGGSIYGDGVVFTLVLDIKEYTDEMPAALHALLASYPMFAAYTASEIAPAAVRVILSGNVRMKETLVEFSPRNYARDSNDYTPYDPPNDDNHWVAYALDWQDYFSWDGSGSMPADEQASLQCIVDNANANHRSVRLWDAPDNENTWQAELDAGVRFINTDHLAALDSFLASAQTD